MPTLFDTSFDTLKQSIQNISPAKIVVISDKHVGPLHLNALLTSLESLAIDTLQLIVPAGEKSKSRETKAWIEDYLAEKNCGRDTLLVALGGGMITDLVGFVAATYCRGIPLILIPTSLMAMVDAAIGGKNGINTQYGKNTLGTIRLPNTIIINTNYLLTLPELEYRSAFSELIKYALIGDRALFETLQRESKPLLNKDIELITPIIKHCVSIKENLVKEDLFDHGKRALLNFGHTVGHAIETACNYELTHGEAVGLGLFYESLLSFQNNLLTEEKLNSIAFLLDSFSLRSMPKTSITLNQLKNALKHDKKNKNGIAHCTLLCDIGQAYLSKQASHPIDDNQMEELFDLFLTHKKTDQARS